MNIYPLEPRPGERVRASTIVEIIRCLRRITPLDGPGVRTHVTPSGTHLVADGHSVRSQDQDRGCWRIVSLEGDQVTFGNCYIQAGGKTYDVGEAEEDGDDPTCSIELDGGGIVAVCYDTTAASPVAALRSFLTLASLQLYQNDHTDMMCIPLYKFDDAYAVTCDFRNCPTAVQAEF